MPPWRDLQIAILSSEAKSGKHFLKNYLDKNMAADIPLEHLIKDPALTNPVYGGPSSGAIYGKPAWTLQHTQGMYALSPCGPQSKTVLGNVIGLHNCGSYGNSGAPCFQIVCVCPLG